MIKNHTSSKIKKSQKFYPVSAQTLINTGKWNPKSHANIRELQKRSQSKQSHSVAEATRKINAFKFILKL